MFTGSVTIYRASGLGSPVWSMFCRITILQCIDPKVLQKIVTLWENVLLTRKQAKRHPAQDRIMCASMVRRYAQTKELTDSNAANEFLSLKSKYLTEAAKILDHAYDQDPDNVS